MVASTAELIVAPHPLTLQGRTITRAAELRPGETLHAFLTRAGVDLSHGQWVVSIGGAAVSRLMWDRTRPAHGQVIECRAAVGKSVLRIVALVALAYLTLGTGSFLAGALANAGITGFAAFAIQAGVYMVGSMLINKLLGPKARNTQYDKDTSTTYSVGGARNRARPFEPLQLVFGQLKVAPDYAAQPYAWFEGEDQILYCRFQAGLNVAAVDTLKIGETAISAYSDVVVRKSGFPGSSETLLDWANVDTIAGGALAAATSPGAWVTRTSSAGSTRLAVDIGAQLYDMASDGKFNNASLTFDVERRLLPAGAWEPFVGASASVTLTNKSTKPVRQTLLTDELPAGQYEVRMRKVTADVSSTTASNTIEWGSLKSYQPDSGNYSHYPQLGVRIKATGQLNGSLDELTWVVTAASTPVWTGSAWVTQATSNPGAQMLQFARGIFDGNGRLVAGMGLPDAQIDIEGLQAFMVHCAANGYRFDHAFDSATTCLEVLEAMAAAGLGSVSYHSGKLGVVWITSADPIEAVVSMGNIKAGSFRVDYQTRSTADELEATCFDRDANWNTATVRVMAPGVTAPRETARLAPLGITTQAGLLRAARVAMAQNIYGRKSVSWEMDLEYLTFRRYSVIALSHDLTQWGYGGRLHGAVNSSGVVTLTLDEAVPWNAAASTRKVGLRIPGEVGYRIFSVQAFSGQSQTLTLVEPWPGGVPFPGDAVDNPAHDTIWIYDFKATPGARLRVVQIEPSANMGGARITAVPELDEFWTYVASGAYTVPPALPSVEALAVSNLQVQQRRGPINYDQSTELTLTFDVSGRYDHAQVWGALAGSALELIGETRTNSFGPRRVGNDGTYNVEVRPFDGLGRMGIVASASHTVTLDPPQSGAAGNYTDFVFKRSATQPATPTGNGTPAGWSDAPPAADGNPLWVSTAEKAPGSIVVGAWSAPVQIDGDSLQVQYSVDGATSWHGTFATGDKFARYRVGGSAAWSAAVKIVGENGANGVSAGIEIQSNNGMAFTLATDGTTWTPSSVILSRVLSASLTGSGTTTWSVVSGTFTGSTTVLNATTGAIPSFGPSAMGTETVTLRCTYVEGSVTYTDDVTIFKSRTGLNAALSNEMVTLPASSTGAISSYSGASGQLKFIAGGGEVSTGAGLLSFTIVGYTGFTGTYSAPGTSQEGGYIAINPTTGAYNVTGSIPSATTLATVTFRVTYANPLGGSVVFDRVFKIGKAPQGTQGNTGNPGNPGTNGATAVTAYQIVNGSSLPAAPAVPSGAPTAGNASTPGVWYALPPSGSLSGGQWLFQANGTVLSGTYTWISPSILATFRVANLSAMSALVDGLQSTSVYDVSSGASVSRTCALAANTSNGAEIGLFAQSSTANRPALQGQNTTTYGMGVLGYGHTGVYGTCMSGGDAVFGQSVGNGSKGVHGRSDGNGAYGGYFETGGIGGGASNVALYAQANNSAHTALYVAGKSTFTDKPVRNYGGTDYEVLAGTTVAAGSNAITGTNVPTGASQTLMWLKVPYLGGFVALAGVQL